MGGKIELPTSDLPTDQPRARMRIAERLRRSETDEEEHAEGQRE
jgi:hypothetical protein